jgi:hypothetical protein
MVAKRDPMDGAVWVQIGNRATRRWPMWKRRWLVLECGRVFVPVDTDNGGSEGLQAIRDGAAYAIQHGRLYVDAAWLIQHRDGVASRALANAVRNIQAAAGCL